MPPPKEALEAAGAREVSPPARRKKVTLRPRSPTPPNERGAGEGRKTALRPGAKQAAAALWRGPTAALGGSGGRPKVRWNGWEDERWEYQKDAPVVESAKAVDSKTADSGAADPNKKKRKKPWWNKRGGKKKAKLPETWS